MLLFVRFRHNLEHTGLYGKGKADKINILPLHRSRSDNGDFQSLEASYTHRSAHGRPCNEAISDGEGNGRRKLYLVSYAYHLATSNNWATIVLSMANSIMHVEWFVFDPPQTVGTSFVIRARSFVIDSTDSSQHLPLHLFSRKLNTFLLPEAFTFTLGSCVARFTRSSAVTTSRLWASASQIELVGYLQ